MSDVARICSLITFHLSKLWKVKFSILCDVIFLVGLEGKFDFDHSQEWKGYLVIMVSKTATMNLMDNKMGLLVTLGADVIPVPVVPFD